jgi:hypothetical protein
MDTVQGLRAKADAAGNLKTTPQQVVKTETQGSQTIYVVESPKPDVIYVPTYNPAWSTAAGGIRHRRTRSIRRPTSTLPASSFATGVVVGAAIWGSCNWGWGRGSVDVNVNRYNSFNRTNISNRNWNHNVDHRRGVAYRDQNVARQYNRGGNARQPKHARIFAAAPKADARNSRAWIVANSTTASRTPIAGRGKTLVVGATRAEAMRVEAMRVEPMRAEPSPGERIAVK